MSDTFLTQNAGWHDWTTDGNWLVADITDSSNRRYDIGIKPVNGTRFKALTGNNDWKTNLSPVIVEKRKL